MLAWPRRSLTTFAGTPAASAADAYVVQPDVRQTGRLGQRSEVPRHPLRIDRPAWFGGEHQAAVGPHLTGEEPFLRLGCSMGPRRRRRRWIERHRSATLLQRRLREHPLVLDDEQRLHDSYPLVLVVDITPPQPETPPRHMPVVAYISQDRVKPVALDGFEELP